MSDRSFRQLGYYDDPANAESIARDLHNAHRHRTGQTEWDSLSPERRETLTENIRRYLAANREYGPHMWAGFPYKPWCVQCGVFKDETTSGRCPRA